MANLTVRNLDPDLKLKLRQRAARYGRSMEEEVRVILATTLASETVSSQLGERIHQRFLAVGGLELGVIERPAIADKSVFDAESPEC